MISFGARHNMSPRAYPLRPLVEVDHERHHIAERQHEQCVKQRRRKHLLDYIEHVALRGNVVRFEHRVSLRRREARGFLGRQRGSVGSVRGKRGTLAVRKLQCLYDPLAGH
jgi:hypothetical protein